MRKAHERAVVVQIAFVVPGIVPAAKTRLVTAMRTGLTVSVVCNVGFLAHVYIFPLITRPTISPVPQLSGLP